MNWYLDIAVRTLVVYLFMVLGLRIFGKNQLSQLNTGDIVLLLLISNTVPTAMIGNSVTLQGGLWSALILFVANFLLKKIMFKDKKIRYWVEGISKILVKDGVVDMKQLMRIDIPVSELKEIIREHGVESIEEVKLAVLEVDGNISVISMSNEETKYSRHKRKSEEI